MERLELLGAWEGDCLPGGRFCAAYQDRRIVTHRGTWYGPEWLRYPRLSPVADVVVGTRQSEPGQVVSVTADGWQQIAPQSCGLSAVIYYPSGALAVNPNCARPYYSLGFRYVDRQGVIVPAADTYADPARQIFEWTEYDGITIGQGPQDGVHILYNGRRYLLEGGTARVVRFAKEGDQIAVGTFRQDLGFVAWWFTVQDIPLFLDITDPAPPDPPDPEPEPMQIPVVTVDRWTLDELEDGREFIFTDTANPSLGYRVRVHVKNGSMYAEIRNAAGQASTGQARPVKPCDDHQPPDPPPDPKPPEPTRISTAHGTFWTCDWNGVIGHSDRADLFTFESNGPGAVAILAPNGCYVCAEAEGSADSLIANRAEPAAWETFQVHGSADHQQPGGITLRAVNGRYLAAELDGAITCNRQAAGTWETFTLDRPVGTLPRLTIRDRIYFGQATGERFHLIQCSDFSLYKRYLDNEHIELILADRVKVGFNALRVWLLNTSVIPGGLIPSQYASFYDRLPHFLKACEAYGLYVELTAFTQTQTLMPSASDQLDHWGRIVNAVIDAPNVLLELVNEGDQHDNATSAAFPRPAGVLCSSGSNGADSAPPLPIWDYVLYHTNDLNEWQRKTGHNAWEWSEHHDRPGCANENTRFSDRDNSAAHAYDAAAGAALLCAGACFHSQQGKLSEPFSGDQLARAQDWVAGARSVPLEYQPGQYARHDELNGPDCIRAYSRTLPDGRSWLVKIRP